WRTTSGRGPRSTRCWPTRPPQAPRSPSRPGRPSTAATPAASATRTATSGRSRGTPASPSARTARSSCPTSARTRRARTGRARSCRLEPGELPDVGDAQDGRAGLVRRVQVDDRADAPVVVARRIVEDLPDRRLPRLLVDHQQGGPARVRPGSDLVVRVEVALQGLLPGRSVAPALR